jgi:hypothetical protein
MATGFKHDFGTRRKAITVGVTGFVFGSAIGFRFHNFAYRELPVKVGHQMFAQ